MEGKKRDELALRFYTENFELIDTYHSHQGQRRDIPLSRTGCYSTVGERRGRARERCQHRENLHEEKCTYSVRIFSETRSQAEDGLSTRSVVTSAHELMEILSLSSIWESGEGSNWVSDSFSSVIVCREIREVSSQILRGSNNHISARKERSSLGIEGRQLRLSQHPSQLTILATTIVRS